MSVDVSVMKWVPTKLDMIFMKNKGQAMRGLQFKIGLVRAELAGIHWNGLN